MFKKVRGANTILDKFFYQKNKIYSAGLFEKKNLRIFDSVSSKNSKNYNEIQL